MSIFGALFSAVSGLSADSQALGMIADNISNSNTPAYTCYNCHNKAETEKHHAEKNIFDIANRCAECHPNGSGD